MLKQEQHDPFAALRFRDYRLFAIGRLLSSMGYQMQSVAIGWELYERTANAMVLGGVGLVQVIPVIVLTLPAGHLADRFDRKLTVLYTQMMLALWYRCIRKVRNTYARPICRFRYRPSAMLPDYGSASTSPDPIRVC